MIKSGEMEEGYLCTVDVDSLGNTGCHDELSCSWRTLAEIRSEQWTIRLWTFLRFGLM